MEATYQICREGVILTSGTIQFPANLTKREAYHQFSNWAYASFPEAKSTTLTFLKKRSKGYQN